VDQWVILVLEIGSVKEVKEKDKKEDSPPVNGAGSLEVWG